MVILDLLCILGNEQPFNLIIVVMNNECYEVIGGQPMYTFGNIDLSGPSKSKD